MQAPGYSVVANARRQMHLGDLPTAGAGAGRGRALKSEETPVIDSLPPRHGRHTVGTQY